MDKKKAASARLSLNGRTNSRCVLTLQWTRSASRWAGRFVLERKCWSLPWGLAKIRNGLQNLIKKDELGYHLHLPIGKRVCWIFPLVGSILENLTKKLRNGRTLWQVAEASRTLLEKLMMETSWIQNDPRWSSYCLGSILCILLLIQTRWSSGNLQEGDFAINDNLGNCPGARADWCRPIINWSTSCLWKGCFKII